MCFWQDTSTSIAAFDGMCRVLKGRPLCIKLRCTFVLLLCASGNRSKLSPKIKKVTKDRPFKRILKKAPSFSSLSNKVSSESAQSFLDYKAWLGGFVLGCGPQSLIAVTYCNFTFLHRIEDIYFPDLKSDPCCHLAFFYFLFVQKP